MITLEQSGADLKL